MVLVPKNVLFFNKKRNIIVFIEKDKNIITSIIEFKIKINIYIYSILILKCRIHYISKYFYAHNKGKNI